VHVLPANPGLAEYLRVSVVDQARTYAVHDATTQGLARQEAARRAEQVEDAGRKRHAPRCDRVLPQSRLPPEHAS
jgi:hypothetical protein